MSDINQGNHMGFNIWLVTDWKNHVLFALQVRGDMTRITFIIGYIVCKWLESKEETYIQFKRVNIKIDYTHYVVWGDKLI